MIYRFTLEDAIRRGILCELDYLPLEYAFSDDDKAAVRRAFAKFHARVAAGENPSPEELYQEVARVRKLSAEKIPVFRAFLEQRPSILDRTIIFVETADYGLLVQQAIINHSADFHTYYAEDDRANLIKFARGEIDCLITCRRISEGIDIKSVNNIVLFSAARARLETIQRVGRCLRSDSQNPDKRAAVVDFIRTDELDPEEQRLPSTDDERREWLSALGSVRRQQ